MSGAGRVATPSRRARLWRPDETEHDARAIIANVKKDGRPSHGNVKRTLEAPADSQQHAEAEEVGACSGTGGTGSSRPSRR